MGDQMQVRVALNFRLALKLARLRRSSSAPLLAALAALGTGLCAAAPASAAVPAAMAQVAGAQRSAPAPVADVYGRLPLSFEANAGQADPQVAFTSRGPGYSLFLTQQGEAVLQLERPGSAGRAASFPAAAAVLRLRLAGASQAARCEGLDELAGKANYFIGADPQRWHAGVPLYAQVRVGEVYPGVALVFHGRQRQLEEDFVVAPGADPSSIALAVEGADSVSVDEGGDLVLALGDSDVRLHAPQVYQDVEGVRRPVAGRYALKGGGQVGFRLGTYDLSRPLVIDPVLSYSTYLGGSSIDGGAAIAVDSAGNAYVTGFTSSSNFPTTAGAVQAGYNAGVTDAFVTKLDPTGTSLVYSTYLGGTRQEEASGIAVDAAGNAYVAGWTLSTDFPTTAGAFQTAMHGVQNAFVTALNPAGGLIYSTFLGGLQADGANAIAVSADGNAYVTGSTGSVNFPTTPGAYQTTLRGLEDVFVTELNASGSALVFSTFLGNGGFIFEFGSGIAVDASGVYVAGSTDSSNFPTTGGAFQTTYGGGVDAFVAKLSSAGSALVYSTYLGGSSGEQAWGLALDAGGNAYVAGATSSTNFPVSAGAAQATPGGGGDGFVAKLNASGSALVYSTFLGGNSAEESRAIAVDAAGNAYVTGNTASSNFPVTASALQPTQPVPSGPAYDAYVTVVNPQGTAFAYSSYLGGSGDDDGKGIALDAQANAYVTGDAGSTNFPTTAGVVQPALAGGRNAFVAKFTGLACTPGHGGHGDGDRDDGGRGHGRDRDRDDGRDREDHGGHHHHHHPGDCDDSGDGDHDHGGDDGHGHGHGDDGGHDDHGDHDKAD